MLATVSFFAPYLIIFGVGLGLFAGLRLFWAAQPPWLEVAVFATGCLVAFWAVDHTDWSVIQGRLVSPVHAAAMCLTVFWAVLRTKEGKVKAALWAAVLSWLALSVLIWILTVMGTPLTWTMLLASGVLCGLLWLSLGRADPERPFTLFAVLLVIGVGGIAGYAGQPNLAQPLFAVLSLLLAGGAVAFYRPALMPQGVTGFAGLCVAAGAVALSFEQPVSIPALLILALTLFSSRAVTFSKPAGSGLEMLGRKTLVLVVNSVPLLLALMVGYVTLTNP